MATGPSMEWYGGLSRRGIKPGLDAERELLDRLGRPQDSLRLVHVAGTDGKGSVCAIMESVLHASGYKVGMFTSPEICRVNECIRVGCEDIGDSELENVMRTVRIEAERMASEGLACTQFEVLTAASLVFFEIKSVDIAIVEVGMGGRLDSTNVIIPEVSVINNIGLEHTAYLGHSISEIAMEKAGIMKPGVPCVTINSGDALAAIRRKSDDVGCPLICIDADSVHVLSMDSDRVRFEFDGSSYTVWLPGEHQARNAALALTGLRQMGGYDESIAPNVQKGLSEVRWPGRMQKLPNEPVIVDVTHTRDGAECLRRNVEAIYGEVILVIGVLSDKDADGILESIAPVCSHIIVTSPESPRAMPCDELETIASKHADVDCACDSLSDAMEAAYDLRTDENILVTGSFRMAQGVLEWLRRI